MTERNKILNEIAQKSIANEQLLKELRRRDKAMLQESKELDKKINDGEELL